MNDLQQYNEAFRAFLQTLNPAQQLAVETTEGPVLVVAGPGTGKTHILTARIGNILLRSDARAQNVLCLTFTDAGANAMRQRLLERIGPEAHRVPIFTFHAFCNRVIQENPEAFGKGKLEPLSELERIEMVRQMLVKLPTEHPLREGRKDIFQFENHLRDLFSTMKKEGWTPGFVLKKCDEFIRGLPTNPDFIYKVKTKNARKGDLKQAQIDDVIQKMTRLKAAADLYPRYQQMLERSGRYEYEDMLLWVTKAFSKNEALLRTYQERYQYVLVDEFQDTNGAQFQLLNQLLDYWEIPNIFIVGDDDQSIFEFQGARLENLVQFYQQYRKGLQTIVLEENYRSAQPILDISGTVIRNNTIRAINRLDQPLTKVLRAMAPRFLTASPGHVPARMVVYENRLHELADVAGQIQRLIAGGTPPSDIAVLYARHRQATRLLTLFEKKGIPYQTKRPVDALELPVMQQFRELLTYLREEVSEPFSGDHRLFPLLHASFFNLASFDLARIALAIRRAAQEQSGHGNALYVKAGQVETRERFWRALLSDTAFLETLQLSDFQKYVQLAERLNGWVADAANLPLPQLVERLYTQSGLVSWALNQPDRVWHIQVLHTFMEFVRRESARNPRLAAVPGGLGHLLDLMRSMDDNQLAMPVAQPVQSGPGVQMLTAHSAKGLEFEHVFLFDCSDDAWEKSAGNKSGRFPLPPTLTLSGEEDAMEARRRLFYVALTRAKANLQISWAATADDGKAITQTRFADETALPHEKVSIPSALLLETQTQLLLEPPQPVISFPEPALLDELLADFSLSITAMNRYLRCPLAFYYEDVLKIPAAMSEAAAFGVAMHGALQQFTLKMKADKKMQWPSADSLLRIFTQEMDRQRGYFSENGFIQRMALGKDYLRRIHVEQVPYWRKRAIVERKVDKIELDGVPLTGVIDKVEWLENRTIRVVDYKTGTPDPKKTAPPDEKQPHGGEYWRQMAFYRVLLETARIYPEEVGKTAISWLEPDKRGVFQVVDIEFSGAEILAMRDTIKSTWSRIQARTFDTGCGKDDCTWCNMHRTQTLAEVMTKEEEGLDD
ncbi:MAG TPA: ATP-dependent DNA helicase [Saprospiraceae bacterium]|nr:ATP-dependent DNA helicase [Saprospiraceae bacterium]HPI08035.1 ATP-dependent DNA helicase [Saprospiraceae bacterium]